MNETKEVLKLQWNAHLSEKRTSVTVITILFLILGTIGNLVVLLTYAFEIKNFKNDRFFIPVLAFVDLIASALISSFIIRIDTTQALFTSSVACKVLECFTVFFVMCSPLLLLLIAIQRYLKVCRPLGKQFSLKWQKIAILITAIISATIALPFLQFSGTMTMEDEFSGENLTGSFCAIAGSGDPSVEWVFLSGIFSTHIGNIIVISGLYINVGFVIFKTFRNKQASLNHNKNTIGNAVEITVLQERNQMSTAETASSSIEQSNDNVGTDPARRQRIQSENSGKTVKESVDTRHNVKIRFTAMLMTIFFFYVISYLSLLILLMSPNYNLHTLHGLSVLELNLYLLVHRLYITNNIVNPLIYGCFDIKFRDAVKRLIRRLFCSVKCLCDI